jgi:hypothetical protein
MYRHVSMALAASAWVTTEQELKVAVVTAVVVFALVVGVTLTTQLDNPTILSNEWCPSPVCR